MKPTIKKLLTPAEIIEHSLREQELQRQGQLMAIGEQEKIEGQRVRQINERYEKLDDMKKQKNKYFEFCSNVKKTLLIEAIHCIFNKALHTPEYVTESDVRISYGYITKFVEEQGVETLLREFKTKTAILSEFSNIINRHYKTIIEKADDKDATTFIIEDEEKAEFFEDIDTEDVEDIAMVIKQRVEDAVSQFVDDNASDKEKIKEIIAAAKEKIDGSKDDSVAESFRIKSINDSNDIRAKRSQTIFENMVLSISRGSVKNEALKEMFSSDNKLDMDKIVESARVMYTFLEMVNTCKMVNVNKDYVTSVYEQLNQ